MNILYLTMAEIDPASGVYKKIRAQEDAFEKNGYRCKILFVKDDGTAILEDKGVFSNVDLKKEDALHNIIAYLQTCSFCYARFELLRHLYYKKMLHLCKHSEIGIIIEIPTYPPYQESMARVREKISKKNFLGAMKTLVGASIVVSDMNRLVKYSDVMVLVADDTEFKGTKTIRIENGINLESNPFQVGNSDNARAINVIAVSNFAIWNGYDRAIRGLAEYYHKMGRSDVHLTFVGDKGKAVDLISLVEKEKITDLVTFTGALSGKELDYAYAQADIALGALGNHRRKVFANSSLKAKEYAARGMLMVLSDAEGIEQEIFTKSFIVKSDESPLDFGKMTEWYKSILDKSSVRKDIHAFAMKHYSWDSQMKLVLDAYEGVKRGKNGKIRL